MVTPQQQSGNNSQFSTMLLGQTLEQLQQLCAEQGFPKFTARQLCDWMYKKRVFDIDAMTNLSMAIRARLKEMISVGASQPVDVQQSKDGTKKYLFIVLENQHIEAVYIPAADRATLCVSCQAGCKMGCRFCVTGQQGFHGNLSVAEILNQMLSIPESQELSNVVFMGMGEPMDNYDAILQTLQVMTSDWGLAWSPHRITVSSVGVTPMLQKLIEQSQCHVAVSLHSPFSDERATLMPMEKAWPIEGTLRMLRQYEWNGQRRVSFEYTMFDGINDDIRHAAALVKLLRGLRCRVNLIRFHASPGMPYQPSPAAVMEAFESYLNNHGVVCTIRASRGEDIMAACGLLAGKSNSSIN